MIVRLAWRSLAAQPVRSAVLACGFGLGVTVMAALLGVGDVVLEQARDPALLGGGDLVLLGTTGTLNHPRFLTHAVLGREDLRDEIVAVAPGIRRALYLVSGDGRVAIDVHGGIPSLDRRVGSPEVAQIETWRDGPGDAAWLDRRPASVLRSIDGAHPVPDAPRWRDSWVEWWYFNGRNEELRFYLTFLTGSPDPSGRRPAGVRLQLQQDGVTRSFVTRRVELEPDALTRAPDLDIGGCSLRLTDDGYAIRLALIAEDAAAERDEPDLLADLRLGIRLERAFPPYVVRGAEGWQSGYVVPVLSGPLEGTIEIAGRRIELRPESATGYHDHNWGFWEGVTWRWGEARHDDLSLVYGRIIPPARAVDPERLPSFLTVLGPDGPLGFSTAVTIDETDDEHGRPERIEIRAGGPAMDLTLRFRASGRETTPLESNRFGIEGFSFLQLAGRYAVAGRVGGREIDFEAEGTAETFRDARGEGR